MARRVLGSIAAVRFNLRLIASALVLIIGACTAVLSVGEVGRAWTVGLQVASVVAGAALGNVIQVDVAKHVVRNQARPAIRHLFDQVTRLQRMFARLEARSDETRRVAQQGEHVDLDRLLDWFSDIGENVRNEITSTATAIENWGDMATDVLDEEFTKYGARDGRLPVPETSTEGQR